MTWMRTATGALAIFGTATVFAMGHALIAEKPIYLTKLTVSPSGDSSPAEGESAITGPETAVLEDNKITLDRAYELFEEGVSFIDARRASDFEAGRIEFAFHLPSSRISRGEGYGVMEMLPFDGPIVIYCTGGDCSDSTNVETLLSHAGYTGILIMNAGYDDWVAAGYPTESGPIDGSVP